MKHPKTGAFMMPVHERLHKKLRALSNDAYVEQDGVLWATAEVMSELTGEEYYITNEDFDPVVRVDYESNTVFYDERSGWSRTYKKSFSELQRLARKYGTAFDIGDDKQMVAKLGYDLMRRNLLGADSKT